MAWVEPKYTKARVNKAGKRLLDIDLDDSELFEAFDVLNNWRSSHSFPLNTLQNNLRKSCLKINDNALVAQRLKRLNSIINKLMTFPTMTLSQMQDIGGCRGIVYKIEDVYKLHKYYTDDNNLRHEVHTCDDYITSPKDSGYRGVHIIFRYQSDRTEAWNSLKIEMQIRTRMHHAWATCVEVVGTFTQQALKSGAGDDDWRRLFVLSSGLMSTVDGTATPPNFPQNINEAASEFGDLIDRLDAIGKLRLFGQALKVIRPQAQLEGARYYLLKLDVKRLELQVTPFAAKDMIEANEQYATEEMTDRRVRESDVVLVSVDDVKKLSTAYPNYYLDTNGFVRGIGGVLRKFGQHDVVARHFK